jgi:uncharacterized membrane protein YkvA (DUF1232 family)
MFAFIAQIKLTWRLMQDRRVPLLAKVLPVLALIYLVWPLDLIPDFLVGLGQLDDITVLVAAMRAMERMSPPEVVAEHRDILSGRQREGDRIIVTDYTVKKK